MTCQEATGCSDSSREVMVMVLRSTGPSTPVMSHSYITRESVRPFFRVILPYFFRPGIL